MQFVGSSYEGLTTADGRRFDGLGQYTFVNGDRYVGGFCDGQFHGHGVIFFRKRPAVHGRHISHTFKEEDYYNKHNKNESSTERNVATSALLAELLPHTSNNNTQGHDDAAAANTQEEDNKQNDVNTNNAADNAVIVDDDGEWEGQYRGVWQHGRNVSGCYVYADGLVYGGQVCKNNSAAEVAAAQTAQAAWPYCQSSDHRLWEEHLRHVTPVLPYETILGGTTLLKQRAAQAKKDANTSAPENIDTTTTTGKDSTNKVGLVECWAKMPIVVPTSCEQEMVPEAFARGQPREGGAVPNKWWEQCGRPRTTTTLAHSPTNTRSGSSGSAKKKKNEQVTSPCCAHHNVMSENGGDASVAQCVMQAITLPTPPLLPEVDPDHYDLTVQPRHTITEEEETDEVVQTESEDAGNVTVTQEKCKGRRVENPNLRERYPLDITDGSRRLAK